MINHDKFIKTEKARLEESLSPLSKTRVANFAKVVSEINDFDYLQSLDRDFGQAMNYCREINPLGELAYKKALIAERMLEIS